MTQSRYSILFSSNTGNTKLLAEAIRKALPAEYCDYFGDCAANEPESDMVYVGFWTNKGIADDNALSLLKTLRNKKIFLFRSYRCVYMSNIRRTKKTDHSQRLTINSLH